MNWAKAQRPNGPRIRDVTFPANRAKSRGMAFVLLFLAGIFVVAYPSASAAILLVLAGIFALQHRLAIAAFVGMLALTLI